MTVEEELDTATPKASESTAAAKVKLLVCGCGDCTHWEIGPDFIICKTCGLRVDGVVVTAPAHEALRWEDHER